MPINYKNYPPNWRQLREHIVEHRAERFCECTGQCGHNHTGGQCEAYHESLIQRDKANPAEWRYGLSLGETPQFHKRVKVILTVAHTCHKTCQSTKCDRLDHLLALCQFCHLHLDQEQHIKNAKQTRALKKARRR